MIQTPEENHCLPKKRAIGFALYFNYYSTWEGRTLFLEDLYVDPASRDTCLNSTSVQDGDLDLLLKERY